MHWCIADSIDTTFETRALFLFFTFPLPTEHTYVPIRLTGALDILDLWTLASSQIWVCIPSVSWLPDRVRHGCAPRQSTLKNMAFSAEYYRFQAQPLSPWAITIALEQKYMSSCSTWFSLGNHHGRRLLMPKVCELRVETGQVHRRKILWSLA